MWIVKQLYDGIKGQVFHQRFGLYDISCDAPEHTIPPISIYPNSDWRIEPKQLAQLSLASRTRLDVHFIPQLHTAHSYPSPSMLIAAHTANTASVDGSKGLPNPVPKPSYWMIGHTYIKGHHLPD